MSSTSDIRETAKIIRKSIVGKKQKPAAKKIKPIDSPVFSPVDYEVPSPRVEPPPRVQQPPRVEQPRIEQPRAEPPPRRVEQLPRTEAPRPPPEPSFIQKLINPQANTELMKQTRLAQLGISKLVKKEAGHKNVQALLGDLTGVAGASVKLVKSLSERLKAYASAFEQINADIWRLADSADSEKEKASVKAIQSLADQIMKDSIDNLEVSLSSAGRYILDKDRDELDRFVKTMKQIHRESLRSLEEKI